MEAEANENGIFKNSETNYEGEIFYSYSLRSSES